MVTHNCCRPLWGPVLTRICVCFCEPSGGTTNPGLFWGKFSAWGPLNHAGSMDLKHKLGWPLDCSSNSLGRFFLRPPNGRAETDTFLVRLSPCGRSICHNPTQGVVLESPSWAFVILKIGDRFTCFSFLCLHVETRLHISFVFLFPSIRPRPFAVLLELFTCIVFMVSTICVFANLLRHSSSPCGKSKPFPKHWLISALN